MTPITVLRNRYVPGWPRHADGERAYVVDLGHALEREYSTDAHFAAYRTPNGRRLVREAIDQGVEIELTCIVFDVDCQDVHGTDKPVPYEWRQSLRERVVALSLTHPKPYFYETKGGARIVYRQAQPTLLRTHEDAREWSQVYAIAIAYLARQFRIAADPACGDWQRLFRLPRATREPNGKPENRPAWYDAHGIGTLIINATSSDLAVAKKTAPRPFREPRELPTHSGSGDGLLYHALKQRGHVLAEVRREGAGGWIILCPNRAQHTSNTDGGDATVLFRASNGEIGHVHCLHAHCATFTQRDWLQLFSKAELDDARRAAGIEEHAA